MTLIDLIKDISEPSDKETLHLPVVFETGGRPDMEMSTVYVHKGVVRIHIVPIN